MIGRGDRLLEHAHRPMLQRDDRQVDEIDATAAPLHPQCEGRLDQPLVTRHQAQHMPERGAGEQRESKRVMGGGVEPAPEFEAEVRPSARQFGRAEQRLDLPQRELGLGVVERANAGRTQHVGSIDAGRFEVVDELGHVPGRQPVGFGGLAHQRSPGAGGKAPGRVSENISTLSENIKKVTWRRHTMRQPRHRRPVFRRRKSMSELTGGELLARALANEGVKFVFGLPCPEIDPLLAALDANGIRFVTIRHEAAAVHMAEGLYKTTGKVAVVLGNPGPGTANLVPGLLTARHEGVPVLAITSQHRAGVVYPSTPATFQGQDQLDLIKPAVKWNGPVFEWTRIPELVRMAFREMWAGRPGPVHLEIPGPVLYATGDPATAPIHPGESGRSVAAAGVRVAARGGRGAAREREDAGDLRRHRRRSRPGERRADRARRTARLSGDPVDGGTCRHAARSPAVLPLPESGGRRTAPQRGRDAGRGFARRQSRRALRQVLGRPREVPGHSRRRGPAAHRRVPSRRDRHGRRCPHGSRRTGREASRPQAGEPRGAPTSPHSAPSSEPGRKQSAIRSSRGRVPAFTPPRRSVLSARCSVPAPSTAPTAA